MPNKKAGRQRNRQLKGTQIGRQTNIQTDTHIPYYYLNHIHQQLVNK